MPSFSNFEKNIQLLICIKQKHLLITKLFYLGLNTRNKYVTTKQTTEELNLPFKKKQYTLQEDSLQQT